MTKAIDVDLWLRGTTHAVTVPLARVPGDAATWTEEDVRVLLTEMLLALERQQNPDQDAPTVTLKGFSWIVSPDTHGVMVHLEMQLGTVSAGPFAIDEPRLNAMITRTLSRPAAPVAPLISSTSIH